MFDVDGQCRGDYGIGETRDGELSVAKPHYRFCAIVEVVADDHDLSARVASYGKAAGLGLRTLTTWHAIIQQSLQDRNKQTAPQRFCLRVP
jgi:hypothetical protein